MIGTSYCSIIHLCEQSCTCMQLPLCSNLHKVHCTEFGMAYTIITKWTKKYIPQETELHTHGIGNAPKGDTHPTITA